MPEDAIDYFSDALPAYVIGQVVCHRRYGYRGVVVDFDMRCQADTAWYQHNQTRPDRDQPWYHVLVDGSDASTYAAETSLAPDGSDGPIDHPLLGVFFGERTGGAAGRYVRSDAPWPAAWS